MNTQQTLGEFGHRSGTYRVVTVSGKVREIRNLWDALDTADACETDAILAKLRKLGALVAI